MAIIRSFRKWILRSLIADRNVLQPRLAEGFESWLRFGESRLGAHPKFPLRANFDRCP
jgi:hypothetical protein